MPKRKPHLSSLFHSGTEVTIVDTEGNEYPIWVQRPSSLQQEESREYASAKVARFKLQAKDKKSDTYMALQATAQDDSYDDLLSARLRFEEPSVRDAALSEVLYTEGSEWSEEDKYFGLITAMSERFNEIERFNNEMEEAGSEERIDIDTDEKLLEVSKEHDRFQDEVQRVGDAELERLKEEFRKIPEDELREQVVKKTLDLDARMQWYEAYRTRMLSYACRFPEDHKKLYFASHDEVMEVPYYIRSQLFAAYDEVEKGSEDVKNSLSLLSS